MPPVSTFIAVIGCGSLKLIGAHPTPRRRFLPIAPPGEKWHSRILLIVGPEAKANRERLDKCFVNNFVYNMDEIIDHSVVNGLGGLEYRFASHPCQAQFAYQTIHSNFGVSCSLQQFSYHQQSFREHTPRTTSSTMAWLMA
ncbi:hypothetical protein DL770_006130 [Monosporascus sp. CRB-9-2]|nr:hypothetical protein DL770_006130 [Monosporascus sp. CRB-9-2]